MATITCSSCRQAKPELDFSKSQRKKLSQNPNSSAICEPCKGNTANNGSTYMSASSHPVSALAQVAKSMAQATSQKTAAAEDVMSNDPSLQYYKHPLYAPIVTTFQDFFAKELESGSKPPEIFYNRKKEGWRTASKLPVRSEIIDNDGIKSYVTKIGLFTPGSHKVIECLSSPIHHPAINHALVVIKDSMQRVGLHGYNESIGDDLPQLEATKACIKYLMIAVQRHTNMVQVTLVTQSPRNNRHINPLLIAWSKDLVASSATANPPVQFHSIWVNHHYASKHCNTITGRDADDWRVLYTQIQNLDIPSHSRGSVIEYLDDYDSDGNLIATVVSDIQHKRDRKSSKDRKETNNKALTANPSAATSTSEIIPPVVKVPLYFPPNVFRQANLGVFRTIVYDIRAWLQNTAQVHALRQLDCLELYGGVGTIGLHCLDLVRRLVCSDENPNNEACFQKSVAAINTEISAELARKATYLTGKSADLAKRGIIHENFDVLIVDPPRKGLEPEVMEQLLLDPNEPSKKDSMNDGNQDEDPRKRKIHIQPAVNTKKKIIFDENGGVADSTVMPPSSSTIASSTGDVHKLKRLIYVSCGFEAFQRDCQMLTGDESVRQSYTISQTTSYPTMVSSSFVPGMVGTVHTHYHHNTSNSNSATKTDTNGQKLKKRKLAHPTANNVSSSDKDSLVATLLRQEGIEPSEVLASSNAVDGVQEENKVKKGNGKWRLVFAKGYLMFPGANHIETLAIFDRNE